MNLNEITAVAQRLPMPEQKALIKTLFQQMPKPSSLDGSIVHTGDLEAGTREINQRVQALLRDSAEALIADESEE